MGKKKQNLGRLSNATKAKIEAVEKLEDFFECIDIICKDFEKYVIQQDSTK